MSTQRDTINMKDNLDKISLRKIFKKKNPNDISLS